MTPLEIAGLVIALLLVALLLTDAYLTPIPIVRKIRIPVSAAIGAIVAILFIRPKRTGDDTSERPTHEETTFDDSKANELESSADDTDLAAAATDRDPERPTVEELREELDEL